MAGRPENLLPTRGFAPRDISARVNHAVIRQHAAEAAFLFAHRSRAVRAPHYKLKHLAKLDARLQGHLRGLRIGGTAAFAAARALLGDVQPGAMFVVSFLAFVGRQPQEMYDALQLALAEPTFESELLSALAWLDAETVRPALGRLRDSAVPAHRRIGLSACLAHGICEDAEIQRAAREGDLLLRAWAFRAIGEGNRKSLRIDAERGLRDSDALCRFWAGWSLAMHGDAPAAIAAYEIGRAIPLVSATALEMAMRCGESDWSHGIVRSLAQSEDNRREAIRAVGMLGDPVSIPWILKQMGDPQSARLAGEAFSTITGADLRFLDLRIAPPPTEDVGHPDDAGLEWPNAVAVHEWWVGHRAGFAAAPRYLCGLPVSAQGALRVLRESYQRQRAMAALELARLGTAPVFAVESRADWQRKRLATCN
jgi:uncharacterized protein (TIGR02270 family)